MCDFELGGSIVTSVVFGNVAEIMMQRHGDSDSRLHGDLVNCKDLENG